MAAIRKHSKKRDALLAIIRSTDEHPGAQWIYEQAKPSIPDLSLGTVYRNLVQFREDGMVMSVGVVGGEERFDGNVEPHQHFVCERCGSVIDIPALQGVEREIEALLKMGHRVDYRKTIFYGLCGHCVAKAQGGEAAYIHEI